MAMTTKSGTSTTMAMSGLLHLPVMLASTEFIHKYAPFHSNNFSGAIGGPVWPGHKFGFFFFGLSRSWPAARSPTRRALRTRPSGSRKGQLPQYRGTKLLSTYPVSGVSDNAVSSTAADFPPGSGRLAELRRPGICRVTCRLSTPATSILRLTAMATNTSFAGMRTSTRIALRNGLPHNAELRHPRCVPGLQRNE